ncbi:hypothetical protein D3C72_1296700 [compost metagenome]
MTIGDRLSNGTYSKENKRHFHEFGNNLVKKSINILFQTDLNDIMTGYRVFNKLFVKTMPVMSPKFEIETEMSLHALDKKFIIKEIPIIYRDRPEGSVSKLDTVGDGIKVVKTIVKMLKDFKPRKFYWSISLIIGLVGFFVGLPVIIEFFTNPNHYITKIPSAILATGIEIIALIIAQCGVILDTVVKQNKENYEIQLSRFVHIEEIKNNK